MRHLRPRFRSSIAVPVLALTMSLMECDDHLSAYSGAWSYCDSGPSRGWHGKRIIEE